MVRKLGTKGFPNSVPFLTGIYWKRFFGPGQICSRFYPEMCRVDKDKSATGRK